MKQIISMQQVGLKKGEKWILDRIDWQFNAGEQWVILGLNGSGKTALLNTVMGYHYPTTGQVEVLGNTFGRVNLPQLRTRIGLVSSSVDRFSQTLNKETVERVVVSGKYASFGLYKDVSAADWERADQVLEQLRLSYLRGQRYATLSQGEQRRVLIARAWMSAPEVLILDEPCTGLDIRAREEVLALTEKIMEAGCHVIYVTHHMEELLDQMTHVLLLKQGKVLAAGEKHDVLTNELLQAAYEVPVQVHWNHAQPSLTINRN